MELPDDSFDLAYSSLTVHYLSDLARFTGSVHRALVPGGRFVCSIEHPIYTAPSSPSFVTDVAGRVTWPLDQYLLEGPRTTDWLAPGIVKHHRTVGTYLKQFHRVGFTVNELIEWGPSAEQIGLVPEWAIERDRPMFLLISADRT